MAPAGLDALLQKARQGDSRALGEVVDAYAARVFGLLYRLTNSQDTAEDLTQETFLRVARTIQKYDHLGRFEPWLFRIAANLARDHARKNKRRGPQLSLQSGEGDDGFGPGQDPTDVRQVEPGEGLAQRELGARLTHCLARLSETDREILLLRHFSELSFKEIAELLEIPLGTALARAHRALRRLREDLTDEPERDEQGTANR